MKPEVVLTHEFVEFIPEELRESTLYVCIRFATVVHRCCCGCGREVVTPLSPTDWKLIFDGVSVSLYPSIGNWNFPCQSHYWIQHNKVSWAGRWSKKQIEAGRAADVLAKARYFGGEAATPDASAPASNVEAKPDEGENVGALRGTQKGRDWRNLFRRIFGR
jgi:hypothetical protein